MDSGHDIVVLYVNDEPDLLELLRTRLEDEDERLTVLTAESVDDGLDLFRAESIDCVLSDYHMPGRNGLDFLRAVREMDPDLPFIMFTETGSEVVASESIDAGVTDYVIREPIGNQATLVAQKVTTHVESRWANDRAERTNRQLQNLAETSDDVFWIFSPDWGEVQFVNSAYEAIFGQPVAALREEPQSFLDRVHEADVDEVRTAMGRVSSGREQRVEYRVRRSEGLTLWVESRCKPVIDADGTVQYLAGYTREITERKEREREGLERNERLEEFASTVAHDLRNPLSVADGYIDLANEECDSDHLTTAADALGRMEELIEELLALAQEGLTIDDRSRVDFAELVRAVGENVLMPEVTLEVIGEGTIECDPSRVRQALENLFRNALEHGDDSVTITVGVLDGGRGFYVEDDGPGIPPANRDRVFDRGYTTTSRGSGYGLAIVEDIVAAHGWSVSVEEGTAGGARFEITGATVGT